MVTGVRDRIGGSVPLFQMNILYKETKHMKEVLVKKDDEVLALKAWRICWKLKDKEIHFIDSYKLNHKETVKALKDTGCSGMTGEK